MPDERFQELADQRTKDLQRDAYERGVAAGQLTGRLGEIDGRLTDHKRRLDAINGSVLRTGEQLTDLARKIDGVSFKLSERDAVDQALLKAAKASGTRISSRWTRVGIFAAGLFGLVEVIVLLIQALGGGHP